MEIPETRYAKSSDLHIAYQSFGTGPDLVVIPPLVSNVELFWEHELYRRVLEHMARFVRITWFDKRGIGCSDRFEGLPSLDERIEDIAAVMDAESIERASVLGTSEGGLMAQLFAARHPERVDKLVLVNSGAGVSVDAYVANHLEHYSRSDDPPYDEAAAIQFLIAMPQHWGHDPQDLVDWMMPSQSGNPSFIRWVGRLQRQSASPADLARQLESVMALDGPPSLEAIQAPTLVIQVVGDRILGPHTSRYLAEHIPDASFLEVPGYDHFCWVMGNWREFTDAWLAHVIGTSPVARAERRFAAVLFTDLVDSTATSLAAGDAHWRERLDSHDRICHQVVDRHRGRIIKTTGDGVLATFDSASAAVDAAAHLRRELLAIELTIRVGLHAGELEFREDGDVTGAAVNVASRVEHAAEPDNIFVSSTVRDLVLGTEHHFVDKGEFDLKGLASPWRLYSLTTE